MNHLDARNKACGYAHYHIPYPPKGLLHLPGNNIEGPDGCDLWEEIFDAALLVNPAFNVYRIFDTVSNRLRGNLLLRGSECSIFLTVPGALGCTRLPVSHLF